MLAMRISLILSIIIIYSN